MCVRSLHALAPSTYLPANVVQQRASVMVARQREDLQILGEPQLESDLYQSHRRRMADFW
jgi:hypothetical protein